MAYLNGKRILFATVHDNIQVTESYYAFYVKPEDQLVSGDTAKTWTQIPDGRYKVKITSSEYPYTNPYIDSTIVYVPATETTMAHAEKTILDYTVLVNGDLLVYSDELINCKIIIKGDE